MITSKIESYYYDKNMIKTGNKEYLTVKELADILGISRVAVFKKIKKGEIKAEKAGRIYIIPTKRLAWLNDDVLSKGLKAEIDRGVFRVVQEYGEAIKKLGEEKETYAAD